MKPIHLKHITAHYGQNVRFEDNYGDVAELANNILLKGLIQPLIVEQTGDVYNVISGHRRFAALNLLLNDGKIDENYNVNCLVETYKSEIDRTAAKLLANDGQPLSPDEWAAEIGRLSETGESVKAIAKALGKSEAYVKQLKNTWLSMDENARNVIKTGKVSMSLAICLTQQAINPKIASLGVQIAAAAKESCTGVSDKVVSQAVINTTNELMENAKQGVSMSGNAIGASLLNNIENVKRANVAANKARKQAFDDEMECKPVTNVETFLEGLIEAMEGETGCKELSAFVNEIMFCYEQRLDAKECVKILTKQFALINN